MTWNHEMYRPIKKELLTWNVSTYKKWTFDLNVLNQNDSVDTSVYMSIDLQPQCQWFYL